MSDACNVVGLPIVWGHGPKSYNWVLGFGRECGALAESVRNSNPRRNISSDKLNADWVKILMIKVAFQEALVIGMCTINVQERWKPKNI